LYVDPHHEDLSVRAQCNLLEIPRSSYYYEPTPETDLNVELMHQIDKIYTDQPYYGTPRITAQLKREGYSINKKRIGRLMRTLGLEAIYPKKNTSKQNKEHQKYPYLLKRLNILRPNQVWGTDITYVRLQNNWIYLVAMLDWFSRYIISWTLSQSMTVDFCVETLQNALKTAQPEIHNSDQGSQFTSDAYINVLKEHESIQISMDGRGRCFDNIFTERLWRTIKYEEIYLRDYQNIDEARNSLGNYLKKYNTRRLHQSLNYQTPHEVYFNH
jgi:putative transposase